MSNIIDKIKALLSEAEETPVVPPVEPPVEPPVDKVVVPPVVPPVDEVQVKIDAALAKQRLELEAVFTEKLKGVKSTSTPPPPTPTPPAPVVGDMDFKRWNEKVEAINKKIQNQN